MLTYIGRQCLQDRKKEHPEITFSAMIRSPTWKVGYMDLEGINLSSATNHWNAVANTFVGSIPLFPEVRLMFAVLDLRAFQ